MRHNMRISTRSPSKVDIINALGRTYGWTSYLEICSWSTGRKYAYIDQSIYTIKHRLMYSVYPGFNDGSPIDFLSATPDISGCISEIESRRLTYDVILVDPWHEYLTSYRDIELAFRWIKPTGTIVVHDCHPGNDSSVSPAAQEGEWSGVTFEAYIDFVRNRRPELDFFTVDIDHGCGLIRQRGERRLLTYPFAPTVRLKSSPSIDGLDQVEEEWKSSYGDHGRRLLLFEEHADKLLRLRSYAEFLDDLRQDSEAGSG